MKQEKLNRMVKLPSGKSVLVKDQKKAIREDVIREIVALRKSMKLTQQDIADATGIQRPNIARIESRKNTPSIDVLVRCAAAVGKRVVVTLEDIE